MQPKKEERSKRDSAHTTTNIKKIQYTKRHHAIENTIYMVCRVGETSTGREKCTVATQR